MNGIDPSEATFTDALSYDVNQDGTVDLLDITEAQLYYRADKNSSNWNDASKCDFNDDGRIDIEDYMAIWLNFTK
ncbi:MAG: dockerin type I domain-containing protein [Clostridiales bacterium]|nr:MAG: dockerin type I domain-containing protein [Clostridiales bacterium]